MKFVLSAFALLVFLAPSVTHAWGYVQIDTFIDNVNDGPLEPKSIPMTRVVTPTGAYSKTGGTPEFQIPAGPFEVIFSEPPAGYYLKHDNNCTGTVQEGQRIHCHVIYSDAPIPDNPVFFGANESWLDPSFFKSIEERELMRQQRLLEKQQQQQSVQPQQNQQSVQAPTPVPQATTTPVVKKNKSGLSDAQIAAIIGLLKAFGVDAATIATVQSYL